MSGPWSCRSSIVYYRFRGLWSLALILLTLEWPCHCELPARVSLLLSAPSSSTTTTFVALSRSVLAPPCSPRLHPDFTPTSVAPSLYRPKPIAPSSQHSFLPFAFILSPTYQNSTVQSMHTPLEPCTLQKLHVVLCSRLSCCCHCYFYLCGSLCTASPSIVSFACFCFCCFCFFCLPHTIYSKIDH